MTELFRSADVLVREVRHHRSACCVVTFDSFTDHRTLERPGFGQHFLDAAGVDAVHVLSRDNEWYQHPEMLDAMAEVHAATRAYARVVTYGSSMGAYAALRLGGVAGAHAALALSPQFSIDPTVVPWEDRWRHNSARFRPVWERTLAWPALTQAFVVHDSLDVDHRHVALLAARMAVTPVRVPHGGHPVTGFLAETGLLQEAVLAVCRDDFDPAAFERTAAERAQTSPQHLLILANRVPKRQRARKLGLLREAVQMAPHDAGVASFAGMRMGRMGLFDEALALHRRSLELAPGHPNMLLNYGTTLEAHGDLAEALAVLQQALEAGDGAALYVARVAALRAKLRRQAWWAGVLRPFVAMRGRMAR